VVCHKSEGKNPGTKGGGGENRGQRGEGAGDRRMNASQRSLTLSKSKKKEKHPGVRKRKTVGSGTMKKRFLERERITPDRIPYCG